MSLSLDSTSSQPQTDNESWPAPISIPFGTSMITNGQGLLELREHLVPSRNQAVNMCAAPSYIFGCLGMFEVATHRSRNGDLFYHPGRAKHDSLVPVGFCHYGQPGTLAHDEDPRRGPDSLASFVLYQLEMVSEFQAFPSNAELRLEIEFAIGDDRPSSQSTNRLWLNKYTRFVVAALEDTIFHSKEQIVELAVSKTLVNPQCASPFTKIAVYPLSHNILPNNRYYTRHWS